MQSFKHLGLLVSMALFLSQGAFASNANSGSFDLGESARVGSTVLPPGHYKAEWTGPEKAVKVSILRDGKTNNRGKHQGTAEQGREYLGHHQDPSRQPFGRGRN